MSKQIFDNNRNIDWGRTSKDYSIYRDIYPQSFYDKLRAFGVGLEGQSILDLGTGTGVIPRFLSKFGAKFTGTDMSAEQISFAKELSAQQGLDIEWKVCPAEDTGMQSKSFDAITACQCWWYFDKSKVLPEAVRILKPKGRLALLYMNWLPFEDEIAAKSEELVLSYNPDWQGAHFREHILSIPEWSRELFVPETLHTFNEYIPFTRETWCGRIRACRGIGATLPPEAVARFDNEHESMLQSIAPYTFKILHQVWFEIYRVRE